MDNQDGNDMQQENMDPNKYMELQKQYNELQNKFETKKVIYNKINKGLKVISSYLNKKKKIEQEKKKKKTPQTKTPTESHPSNDYTEYNFSEADYETTTNNNTPTGNINDKSQKDSNLFNNNINVRFDSLSNAQNLNKINNKKMNKGHKKHIKVSAMHEGPHNDALMTSEHELMKLLDTEDMLNLKELDELNRLIADGYTLDDNMQNTESPEVGKYCESCNDYVISENATVSSTDEDWDSSDSDESLDISVSGMSGWSGLSGLSHNNKAGMYSEDYQSDDEDGTEPEDEGSVPVTNQNHFPKDKSSDQLVLLKGKKSIQFDTKEELSNQMKIQQHKNEKGKRKSLHKVKTADNEDFSMSDSSLPISRITTQNTANSQMYSDDEMEDNESSQPGSVRNHKKEHGKKMRGTGKDNQYDAIKELHRKAIRMYKKRLIKKRKRMLENKGENVEQKQNTKLRPIKEVLGSAVVLDNIPKKPSVVVPNINVMPVAQEQPTMPFNIGSVNSNLMNTPYRENMLFNGMMSMSQTKDNIFYTSPNMMMSNNMSIETPQINIQSPLNDTGLLMNYKPNMNPMAVSPKFSNVRLSSGVMPRPQIPSSNPSFSKFNVETPSVDATMANSAASPNESHNGGNMTKVIQQFANVYIQPTPTENKVMKNKKRYVKAVVTIPDEFKDKEVITEEDLFTLFGLKISEKTKTAVDIWDQFHEINEYGHSFDQMNTDFGTKWKMKCEAKFIKKYNRRHVMIKAVKTYMQMKNVDDPYECLNRLDAYLVEENKPISYFFIKQHLPEWLQF